MATESTIKRLRQELRALGVEGVDEVAVARLARLRDEGGSGAEQVRAVLAALGVQGIDGQALAELASAAGQASNAEEFADAILIGACPKCGSEATRSLEDDEGEPDPTVGVCGGCGHRWCAECGSAIPPEELSCENDGCWLNEPDDEPRDEPATKVSPASFDPEREAAYVVGRAKNGDVRVLTLGPLVFFSTATGDAWVLDPTDACAAPLAQGGRELPFSVVETETSFLIEWTHEYRIDGGTFTVVEAKSGRTRSVLGCPLAQVADACAAALSQAQ